MGASWEKTQTQASCQPGRRLRSRGSPDIVEPCRRLRSGGGRLPDSELSGAELRVLVQSGEVPRMQFGLEPPGTCTESTHLD